MIRNQKMNKWKNRIIAVLTGITVFSSLLLFLKYDELKQCEQERRKMEEQLDSYCHMLYVAAEKLPKGSVLTEENVFREIRYSDAPQEKFIAEDDLGMTLAMDVAEGTCLTVDMLCKTENDVREIFLSEIELPENFQTGDRIDVRIRYQTAEDYIVLTDKILWKSENGNGMVLRLSEEEILMISSALADSKNYADTYLYAVRYPEYTVLETAEVNYIANRDILVILGREKTEGESRAALELRLMQEK